MNSNIEEILEGILPGVVTVYGRDGPSPGFVVGPTGWVITNNSVVDSSPKATIHFHDGRHERGVAVGTDAFGDLAAIYFRNSGRVQPLLFADLSDLEIGQPAISVVLNPSSDTTSENVSLGKIADLRKILDPNLPTLKGATALRALGNFSNPSEVKANRLCALRALENLSSELPMVPEYAETRSGNLRENDVGDLLINSQGRLMGLGRFAEVRHGLAFPPIWKSNNYISTNYLRQLLPFLQNFYEASILEVLVPAGKEIKLNVPVIHEGHQFVYSIAVDQDDLGVAILDPSTAPLVHHGRVSQVSNLVRPNRAGMHELLLDNSHSTFTPKNTFLAYRRFNPNSELPSEEYLVEYFNYIYGQAE